MRFAIIVTTILLTVPVSFADRGGSSSPGPAPQQQSPEARAIQDYQTGVGRLDKVGKMNEDLKAAFDPKATEKIQKKIDKQLENAVADFKRAIKAKPDLFQAHSELGFALRKLGRFEESLQAYDQALSLQPGYSPAIEYRAEAHLGVNRIDEAKEAYMVLFSGDRPRADLLFAAMKQWVADRRTNLGTADAAQLEQFASWVETRDSIHKQSGSVQTSSNIRSW